MSTTPPKPGSAAAPSETAYGVVYRFGPFELDVGEQRLRRDGRTVALPPQPTRALELLVRRAGRTVTRDELRDRLWGRETFVDHEAGLNTCVRQIRRALGDDAAAPRFVHTVPGRGYRFVAEVRTVDPAGREPATAGGAPWSRVSPPRPAPGSAVRPSSAVQGASAPAVAARRRPRLRDLLPGRAVALPAVLLVVAASAAYALLAGRAPPAPTDVSAAAPSARGAPLVVVAFEDALSDHGASEGRGAERGLGAALGTALRAGIGASPAVRVLSHARLADALARSQRPPDVPLDGDLALDLARREGAVAVVLGRGDRVGEALLLTVSILDPAAGGTVASASREAPLDAPLPALHELARFARSRLGESAGELAAAPALERVTTGDLAALRAYSEAQEHIWARDHVGALPLLRQAVERDPDFAMAHAWLAEILWAHQRPDAARVHAERAVATAAGLGDDERLFVEASAAFQRGDGDAALRAWSLLTAVAPDDFLAHADLAATYLRFANDPGRARSSFLRGLEHAGGSPERGWLLSRVAMAELGLGRFDDAAAHLRAAGEAGYPWACSQRAGALLAARRHGAALGLLDACGDGERPGQWSFRALMRVLVQLDRGDPARAVVLARRLEERAAAGASGQMIAAARLARLLVEERAGAADLEWVVRRFDAERDGLLWSPLPLVAHLGALAARDGDLETARRALAHLDAHLTAGQRLLWGGHREMLAAEVDLAAGRPRRAAARLETLVARHPHPLLARETLLRTYAALGEADLAGTLRRRLASERGRAVAEYPDDSFFDLAANAAALARAEDRRRGPRPAS